MSITSPGCYLYFKLTGYKLEVSTTPSLGSINLLEWLTDLREIRDQITGLLEKDMTQGHQVEGMHRIRSVRRGA